MVILDGISKSVLRGRYSSSRKGIVDGSQNHSTVTDLPMSTPTDNLIPFITFIYNFKITNKGKIIKQNYTEFGIGFYEV